ncbi:MAG: polymer-forming cytoskeletal family protein [Lautropia sp.]|nr:MAG: polymer-forming cytoskeletal family protein [Pseudomonadota bacterium]MBC6960243.1 polymer-forming cytoskeletal family protein [Lautropia sp.]MCL4702662.1 polymer-forming cytoskeletal protein [Burkholderiaceae bacterium]MDL1908022.1 polymer-forming cytoskeletal protein [Betaproteobacteria bacterium PRO1]RIK89626.1 MAG: cell shape determination protein CcmA [Burkholderiales bacterium]
MFGRKKPGASTIDCLIGAGTAIRGDVRFKGGLRIDGEVCGNVIAEEGEPSMLVLSEHARIEGQVRAAHLVVNGTIVGPVQADELLELQPKAQVSGEIRYRALEMHHGAILDGALAHLGQDRLRPEPAGSNE